MSSKAAVPAAALPVWQGAGACPHVPAAPLQCPSLPLRQPSSPLLPNPPPQDDILFQNLTVRETLLFAARIRLPAAVGDDAKAALVEAVISRLGLAKAAGTLVGSTEQRGVSGGERKRVNIGAWPSCSQAWPPAPAGNDSILITVAVPCTAALQSSLLYASLP